MARATKGSKVKGVTLYLRDIPEDVAREARAAAARQGITLRQLVTEALAAKLGLLVGRSPDVERALQQVPDAPAAARGELAAPEEGSGKGEGDLVRLQADMAWYEAHKEELLHAYANRYVAIMDRHVVDHDTDFAPLARRMLGRTRGRSVFMPKVVAGERTVSLPSPRVLRK